MPQGRALAADDVAYPAGSVLSWGDNFSHLLGRPTPHDHPDLPRRIPGLSGIERVYAGNLSCFAVDGQGALWSWGYGTGRHGDNRVPARVQLPAVRQVAVGYEHLHALTRDGRVWSWGNNAWGQLGTGVYEDADTLTPVRIPSLRRIVKVAAGELNSAALDADGRVWVWGNGEHGELADGGRGYTADPKLVPGLPPAVDLAVGLFHVLVVLEDGSVVGWGLGGDGQLGTGERATYRRPAPATGVTDAVGVVATVARSLVLTGPGRVKTFGTRYLGIYREETSLPRYIADLEGVAAISAGEDASFARMRDGTVQAWGSNATLLLGRRGVAKARYPTAVPGLRGIRQVATADRAAIAVT